MIKICFIVLLCFVLLLVTGCATVFTGTKQKMTITSSPPEATVVIYNQNTNQLVRTIQTPDVVELAKNTKYRFVVEKEGYQQLRQDLESGFNPWFIVSLLFGGYYAYQATTKPPEKITYEYEYSYPNGMQTIEKKEPLVSQGSWTLGSLFWSGVILGPDIFLGGYRTYPKNKNFNLVRTNGSYQSSQSQPTPPRQTTTTPSQLPTTPSLSSNSNIEVALAKAAQEVLEKVTKLSKIAIVYITAPDKATTDFISGELEYIWVKEGYVITDRSQLDTLRREQSLQLSGEIDDATAVEIGKFAGADIIVTGRVDGEGNLRRLRLRALDTKTAQVVGVASERI